MSKEKMTALQQLVEETLPTLLPEKDGYNDVLVDAMAYSLLSGGKRLRPVLGAGRPAPLLAASWRMPL